MLAAGLTGLAGSGSRQRIFPVLLQILRATIPRDVPMHAESILPALDDSNRQQFLDVLASRQTGLSPSQLARVRRTTKKAQAASPQANARG